VRTEQLYLRDAYQRTCRSEVIALDGDRLALDRTVLYATGGGQPHDTGTLTPVEAVDAVARPGTAVGAALVVTDVVKDGDVLWHRVAPAGDRPLVLPPPGTRLEVALDWDRRHALMRTHTALHVLCGVIWHTYGVAVTGGNMEPLAARMDFEFDPLPAGFGAEVEARVNAELAADRPIAVAFLPRGVAISDDDLIRTKVNLVPSSVDEIRVVDIVGLDKQADGGTHVRSTGEVGRVEVTKTESKGKAFKRVRIRVSDAPQRGDA
jgi:misacylated tRNA(Ala) deacylase